MGKRILLGILALALTIAIVGCGTLATTAGMHIQAVTLLEKESDIVTLIQQASGEVSQMFDFKVDDKVKSLVFTTYMLDENGKWVTRFGPSSFALQATTGRIAILFNNIDDGMKIAMQDDTGVVGSQIEPGQKSKLSEFGQVTAFADAADIEYDKEIPLMMQFFSSGDMTTGEIDDFYHPEKLLQGGYEEVFVVVAEFSKERLQ